MKNLTIIFLTISALICALYGACGLYTRHNIGVALANLKAQQGEVVEYELEGGIFRSRLQLRYKLPGQYYGSESQDATLVVKQVIGHGPLVWQGQGRQPRLLRAQGWGQARVISGAGSKWPQPLRELLTADLRLKVPLTGVGGKVQMRSPPRNVVMDWGDGEMMVAWQGMKLDLFFPGNTLLAYDLNLRAPELLIQKGEDNEMTLRGFVVDGIMAEGEHGLSLGEVNFGLEELDVSMADQNATITGLHSLLTTREEGGLVSMAKKFRLAGLSWGESSYEDVEINLAISNIAAQPLAQLAMGLGGLDNRPAQEEASGDTLLTLLQGHSMGLLSGSPRLAVDDISVTTSAGRIHLNGGVQFDGEGGVLFNPFFLLGRLSAHLFFEAEGGALQQLLKEGIKQRDCKDPTSRACERKAGKMARARVKALVKAGTLDKAGKSYTYSFSFDEGQIKVNGRPQPLSLVSWGL
ncbi:MAG: DUF945 family protein [Thermodesulfobacteriota bacterium]